MLLLHDSLVVHLGPVGQDGAGDAPEEGAVRIAARLHLIDQEVRMDLDLVLDEIPGVLHRPVRPVLLNVQDIDIL